MKKAQAFSHPFTLLIILLMFGAIALFGYNAVSKIKERQCESELLGFKNDLETAIQEISRRDGAVEELTFLFSCFVDEIYFIDRDKTIQDEIINENPILDDLISSDIKENMFIMNKGELVDIYDIGDITMIPPYYSCFTPSGKKMEMLLHSHNGKVELAHTSERYSCGPTKVREVTNEKVNDTVEEIYNKLGDTSFLDADGDSNVDEDDFQDILNRYQRTKDYVEITREFRKTNDDKTKVIIRINPRPGISLDEFDYIEEITKECMMAVFEKSNIIPGLDFLDDNPPYYEISPDPLIMWHLGNTDITNEERIQYTIDSPDFEELCRELLNGMGWSDSVSSAMP